VKVKFRGEILVDVFAKRYILDVVQ